LELVQGKRRRDKYSKNKRKGSGKFNQCNGGRTLLPTYILKALTSKKLATDSNKAAYKSALHPQ
jgi:ribosomal protein L4